MTNQDLEHKRQLERQLDQIIPQLEQLLHYQKLNYEPYKEKRTKFAIRALLDIRGIKNLKAFHYGDNSENTKTNKQKLLDAIDNQISKLNEEYAKDIIFGLNIAKDLINKHEAL